MNIDINNKEIKQEVSVEEEVETFRLSISKVAAQALAEVVDQVNEGFSGGRVNRSQIANWSLLRLKDTITVDEIKSIRADHLDEFAALDAVLRRAKESGKLPPELLAYVQKQIGIDCVPKKKSKKGLQNEVINDDIET